MHDSFVPVTPINTTDIQLQDLARLVRSYILKATTSAGSGHPSSSLSATDLMTVLMFGGNFKADLSNPDNPNNDRLIFSKGHAAPLLYALYAAAGKISEEELLTLRTFESRLEGHPTPKFEFTEVATGSLGQGLSVGVGMALAGKYLDKLSYTTYVLLGDSEMAEGSNWEALQIAAQYSLDNLVGIIDVNRLGQRGETMSGHDLTSYVKKIEAFGWHAILVDGHSLLEIQHAFEHAQAAHNQPTMIIAKTLKGKGVSLFENKEGWHGKVLSAEQLTTALQELGSIKPLTGTIESPHHHSTVKVAAAVSNSPHPIEENYSSAVAPREAYGHGLVQIGLSNQEVVVLDSEVSNSTFSATFEKVLPDRFFEMYIAEQNMIGTAMGLAARGKKPFVSTFAAFFSRAFDQLRIAAYSNVDIVCVGSHAGVSIGEDGSSQMGLEDIALFRSLFNSTVVYPSDHVSTEKLTHALLTQTGISYMRTTRATLPNLYQPDETFEIGKCKVLRQSDEDVITIVAAGITLHEALTAYEYLKQKNISLRVVDLYSIKPLDQACLEWCAAETQAIITVEDHYIAGGLGEAVAAALSHLQTSVHSLAVTKLPHSGKPEQLLAEQKIDSTAIIEKVTQILGK